ncbi:aluminum-activated malate transporter 10-like [Iris pallida]|uniref:Aluminum-activated malate transporter 10-like n=1 Tax=Iris pallida TaxID=29817 RepID=A0AAX6IHZ4_IRIPA|nr:aluminum-activated malate transporter 10-like [Iris pallida]
MNYRNYGIYGCIHSEIQASFIIEVMVADMNYAVEEVHDALRTLPQAVGATADNSSDQEKEHIIISTAPVMLLMEALPLISVSSLVIEISTRIKEVVDVIEDLVELAGFATNDNVCLAETKPMNATSSIGSENEDMN